MDRQEIIRKIIDFFGSYDDPFVDNGTLLDEITHFQEIIRNRFVSYNMSKCKWYQRLFNSPFKDIPLVWSSPYRLLLGFDEHDGTLMGYVLEYYDYGKACEYIWLDIEDIPDKVLREAWSLCKQWVNRPRESFEKQELRRLKHLEYQKDLVSDENRVCPYCGGRKDKLELLCYYSNDNIMWSDYRHLLPQVAVPSLIQKCPHCGKHYIIKASHVLIKDTADFEFVDPVDWNYFRQSYEEYSKLEKDEVVDYNHRLRMLGAFNDEFRRAENPLVPTEQDIQMFKDNMLHLTTYFQDPLDRAEMCREMGMFEECFRLLDLVEDKGDESKRNYKETIFDLAKRGDVFPFGWKA